MPGKDTRYLRNIKRALTGDPAARLVFICNFEVEAEWARGYRGLPGPPAGPPSLIVQRMEELGALLAGPDDVLVLKQPLDEGFDAYAGQLGLLRPEVLVPENSLPSRSTAADILGSPRLLARLAEIARTGAYLMPMGTSVLEQKVAETCGLPLAVPDAAIFERVNSKAYSRRVAAETGIRTVPGASCDDVAGLADVLRRYEPMVATGRPVVVKECYGVSGKGLVVLDTPTKVSRLLSMAKRRAARTGDGRIHVVVEEWLPKSSDLNYQFTIDRDGRVVLDFVKQILISGGVYRGHLMPAALTPAQSAEIGQAAQAIGGRLFADGFTGVAAADAILSADGTLYPVLEINARLNMSSYQGSVTELRLSAGQVALARHYRLRLAKPLGFAEVREALREFEPGGNPDSGQLIMTCFGTVNANAGQSAPFEGRLYVMLTAADQRRLTALDHAAQAALGGIPDVLEAGS